MQLWAGGPTYRLIFEFWLKIFGIAFGLGVVSGIVMAFQFGTNWSVLARMSGPIQGPLLSFETFPAFTLGAGFSALLRFGHSKREYIPHYKPAKFAAIEGRWHNEQPASEVLIGLPDAETETNHYAISIPVLGSLIASMSLDSKEVGLTDFPPQDRPPVAIPFFSFR